MTKSVVIYHSGYGHTQRIAQSVAEGANAQLIAIDADGNITESDWAALDAADAILMGSPTYMGSVSWQFKKFAELTIRIEGVVKICCDRCLEMFFHPVECEDRLIVKFGKSVGDDDPDIISVAVDAPELDLRQQFYEFILLALPIRRIHPDNSRGESTCDPEMMKKLREHLTEEEHNRDPRWDELKKLINDN